MTFRLEKPVKITKKMIHQVIGYPMLKISNITKTLARGESTKKNLVEWNGRGMKLNNVIDMEIEFEIHVISHKIYNSSRPNSIPCEVVDKGYKVV